jgi:hypothetical protein
MNDKIKAILEKHGIYAEGKYIEVDLNNAIIEICEEQKKECAELTERAKYSKNIAQ